MVNGLDWVLRVSVFSFADVVSAECELLSVMRETGVMGVIW